MESPSLCVPTQGLKAGIVETEETAAASRLLRKTNASSR
jgi:hypothetical protein